MKDSKSDHKIIGYLENFSVGGCSFRKDVMCLDNEWPFTVPVMLSSRKHFDINEQKQIEHLSQVKWKLPRQRYKLCV